MRHLPAENPRSVEHALDLLGIEYDGSKYEHEFRDINLIARCPIPGHPDRHKSFSINSGTGKWICFASTSCGGGSFAWLVSKVHMGVIPMHVIERWISTIGSFYGAPVDVGPAPDLPQLRVRMSDEEFFEVYPLPPSWALKRRGVSEAAASDLSIGWDANAEAFVFPARDPDTYDITGWECKSAVRAKSVWTDPGTKKSRTLFGIDAFDSSIGSAILVESPIDVAVLRTDDFPNGLSSFGKQVSGVQRDLLRKRAPRRIYLALDNDGEGQAAQDKLSAQLRADGHTVFAFNYEVIGRYEKDLGGMDGDEIFEAIRLARRIR